MTLTFLKLSVEVLLLPLKWKLDLFTLKGMCVKIQKKCAVKLKCCMFWLAAMGYRNNFHIILSLAMNCENKLLKI